MCIVTGPRIDLVVGLIDRMKNLFAYSKGLTICVMIDTVGRLHYRRNTSICIKLSYKTYQIYGIHLSLMVNVVQARETNMTFAELI
jgi:hypothetical protein